MQRPRTAEQFWRVRLRLLLSSVVAYAVLAILCTASQGQGNAGPVLWLPAGLIVALALRSGAIAIPTAFLGTLLAALAAGPAPWSTVFTLAVANSATAAALLLLAPRWMGRRELLSRSHNLVGFLAAITTASLLGTVLSSSALPELRDWSFSGGALSWWLSQIAGGIALAPLLLYWFGRPGLSRLKQLARPEFVLLLAVSLLAALLINLGAIKLFSVRPSAVLLPLMLWAALRFSPPAACLIFAMQAIVLTMGFKSSTDLSVLGTGVEANELQQLLVIALGLTALVTLMVNGERTRSSMQLKQLTGSLERTIAERTNQLAAANAALQRLSSTDDLTGLSNRRHFDAVLAERWREAARIGSNLAVAMVDIDHFKAYNDHYGHHGGDLCLQQVAAALASGRRSEADCLARYGGEEFIVLWTRISLEQARHRAERLRQAVAELHLPHAANPAGPQVSLSIGVAASRVPRRMATASRDELQQAIDELIQQADQRLYAAKAAGRNRVVSTAMVSA